MGWEIELGTFCRMNFADKTRQVSQGGGSLSVIDGEMRVEFAFLAERKSRVG